MKMHIYGTLTLVLATALVSESAWDGNHDDFGFHRPRDWRGPFRPQGPHRPHGPYGHYGFHGPYGSHGPHGPRYFHPPHHQYKPPHHEPCDWFRGGGSRDQWQNKAPRPSPPPPATPSTTSTTITSPDTKKPMDCVLDCLKFTNPEDINPVCGSNGVSYRNSITLECVSDCGEDVTLVHRHKCEKAGDGSTIETSNEPLEGPELDSILTCMLRCPTTSEYNPVCGSDGLTYANPGRLECAKMCGRDVEVSKYTRCPTGDITPKANTDATPKANTIATTNPNSNTTSNPTSTTTSNPTSNTTSNPNSDDTSNPAPVTTPPPITNVTPNQNPPSVTPANQPDFTIPQDVLDQIFTKDYNSLIDVRRDKNMSL